MNQQAVRVSQRQIRRALGSEANEMLNQHAIAFRNLNRDITAWKSQLDNLAAENGAIAAELRKATRIFNNHLFLGFWGRLRWLFLGM